MATSAVLSSQRRNILRREKGGGEEIIFVPCDWTVLSEAWYIIQLSVDSIKN